MFPVFQKQIMVPLPYFFSTEYSLGLFGTLTSWMPAAGLVGPLLGEESQSGKEPTLALMCAQLHIGQDQQTQGEQGGAPSHAPLPSSLLWACVRSFSPAASGTRSSAARVPAGSARRQAENNTYRSGQADTQINSLLLFSHNPISRPTSALPLTQILSAGGPGSQGEMRWLMLELPDPPLHA